MREYVEGDDNQFWQCVLIENWEKIFFCLHELGHEEQVGEESGDEECDTHAGSGTPENYNIQLGLHEAHVPHANINVK